jgi:hypothetical protein
MGKRVLVCGSRSWEDLEAIKARLDQLPAEGVTLIHGGAIGADRLAAAYAERQGWDTEEYRPIWRPDGRYNPKAGFERNSLMLDQEPDLVIAFQLNGSGGTQDTIDKARSRGIPVEVISELGSEG